MRFLLLLLCALVSGCAVTRAVPSQRVGGMVVEFDDEITRSDELFALHSVRHIVKAWTKDHGISPRPGRIRIGTGVVIVMNDKRIGGYYRHSKNLIVVASGRRWTLPSLYHELCHMNYAQFDTDHEHEKWPWWNMRGRQIDREVRRCRSDWFWRNLFCVIGSKEVELFPLVAPLRHTERVA